MSAAVLRNLTLLLLGCLTLSRLQAADPDQLLVTGPNFAFSVTEPKGWKGDTANASKVEANIAFYRRRETLDSAAALITIRVFHKEDDETEKDLQADMKG